MRIGQNVPESACKAPAAYIVAYTDYVLVQVHDMLADEQLYGLDDVLCTKLSILYNHCLFLCRCYRPLHWGTQAAKSQAVGHLSLAICLHLTFGRLRSE